MNRKIVQAGKSDLKRIAECHKKAFPKSLASKMGNSFLIKMFDWYLSTDHTFLFFIVNSDSVVGYCGGMVVDGTLAHGSSSSMTQYTFNEAWQALIIRPWLLFHPDFLSRYAFISRNIMTKVKNMFQTKEVRSVKKPMEPYTGLVVIGVDSAFQGKGYGSALLIEFERVTIQKGIRKMVLTVNSQNASAIKSYSRNGWEISACDMKTTKMEKILHS